VKISVDLSQVYLAACFNFELVCIIHVGVLLIGIISFPCSVSTQWNIFHLLDPFIS
jgi:hypothetical protein